MASLDFRNGVLGNPYKSINGLQDLHNGSLDLSNSSARDASR